MSEIYNDASIFEVFDPELGLHSVMVRMSADLGKNFPKKPWGTPITEVGIPKKQSDQFPGYVLVAFEPAKNSDDLFWIFQDLANARDWTTKSKSRDNLTPQKFRGQVIRLESKADVTPETEPTALSGDLISSVVEQVPNSGKAVRIDTTETIDESAAPLDGELYGDIVTKKLSERLVPDGSAADSGILVIESNVIPLGNGKSVKSTTTVKGGSWPDPIEKEVTKDSGAQPPGRYLRDITKTRISRKIPASSIPVTPTLSGSEVGKSYKKETPDRAEETTTSERITLRTSSVDESVTQRPYVRINAVMTPGSSPVVPLTGNGSAQLVYEGPDFNIYENTAEVATARPGPAGRTRDRRPFVDIFTNKRYSTSDNITTTSGSANLIFNDGATIIYEISEETAQARTGPAGTSKDRRPYVEITTQQKYSTSNTIATSTGSSSVVFDDGTVIVYRVDEETASAREGPAGTEKDVRPFGVFTTEKRYSISNSVSAPEGSASVVYSNGEILVYELSEKNFVPTYRDIGIEIEKGVGFTRQVNSKYSGSPTFSANTGSSSIAYTNGVNTVFEVKEVNLVPVPISFVGGRESNRIYTKDIITSYGTSPVGIGNNYDAGVSETDGSVVIYKVNSTTITAKSPLVYPTVLRASIPSTLRSINLFPIGRRDGRTQVSVFVNIEEGFTGSFPGRVTEYFTENPNEIDGFAPVTLKPTAISYQGILFNLSIGETLHGAFTLVENIGTGDPDYLPQTLTKAIPATEPAAIPFGWQPFAVSMEPFESGFLVKKIEIRYR